PARFADLTLGAEINADFVVENGQNIANRIAVGTAGATESPLIGAKVVRVVGSDQVVVKTADGQEMTLYTAPPATSSSGYLAPQPTLVQPATIVTAPVIQAPVYTVPASTYYSGGRGV